MKVKSIDDGYLNEVMGDIASMIRSVTGTTIDLNEFSEASLANPSPFNCYSNSISDGGLQDTLLNYFCIENESILEQLHPFIPKWELSPLEWWQGTVPKGCITVFDQRTNTKKAGISDPLQVELRIMEKNDIKTYEGNSIYSVRVSCCRLDSIAIILEKVRDNWPGVRGRNFVCPNLNQMQITRDGVVYSQNDSRYTTETLDFFNSHREYRISIVNYDDINNKISNSNSNSASVLTNNKNENIMKQDSNSTSPINNNVEYQGEEHNVKMASNSCTSTTSSNTNSTTTNSSTTTLIDKYIDKWCIVNKKLNDIQTDLKHLVECMEGDLDEIRESSMLGIVDREDLRQQGKYITSLINNTLATMNSRK